MSSSERKLNEIQSKIILKFVSDIRNGKLEGSTKIALATISMLEQVISESQNATVIELCGVVRAAGRKICEALPQELVAANMVRRVLRAVRDEHRLQANQTSEGAGESLQRLVLAGTGTSRRSTLGPAAQDLREPLRDSIEEIKTEIESSFSSICGQAKEHVHTDELILTYGASELAEQFLLAAANAGRKFKLILAQGPVATEGQSMAVRLSNAGVPVTVINNTNIFAVMSRVNKVVVGVRAALAGGAALSAVGLHVVTLSAKHYSVPVIILAPLYKLTPLHSCNLEHLNDFAPPQTLPFDACESSEVRVIAPLYDFAPPDHVTLFLTNLGGSSPTYIYRLLSELYDPKDHHLS